MKYYIKTFGCQMNISDSERIASLLEKNNYKLASEITEADLVIFNTCGIRQMAEDRAYGQIHNLRKNNPKIIIILTGCLANRKDVQKRLKDKVDLFCEIKDFEKKFKNYLKTKNLKLEIPAQQSDTHCSNYLSINPKYNKSHSALVPVMTGCNNFCSYCVVPYARGREVSRPTEEIVAEIKNLLKNGCNEIMLLGQNVNSYNYSSHSKPEALEANMVSTLDSRLRGNDNTLITFPKLLQKIEKLPGHFWIRFMSSHPKDFSDELIETIAKSKKICEHIHLPLQAGSDKILVAMNRKYTAKHYLRLVKKILTAFKKHKPDALYSLTSDIIVGFPSETKRDFLETAKVMEKVSYDLVYFGQFSPRPGTVAWKLKDNVTNAEKVHRERLLNDILARTTFTKNKKYVGKILEVVIDSEKNGFYFGRTRTGKDVKIKTDQKNLVGQFVKVKITKANIWNLEANLAESQRERNKIIIILGPTSSGKSSVAIRLAQKFNGEIISADSRQIYRGMDVGTGKVTKAEQALAKHYMLDIVSPKTNFSAAQFKKKAEKIIKDISKRGKLPIICGGTGFWIKALVDDIIYPEVKPDWKLREKLGKKSTEDLFSMLEKLDPIRARNIDAKNPVRLIRAIEICKTLGSVPSQIPVHNATHSAEGGLNTKYDFLQIGISLPKEKLHQNIEKRLKQRFEEGMIEEVEKLHSEKKISWKKMESFGLGYLWIAKFLQKKLPKEELFEKVYLAEKDYAKRQMTWFSKDKSIIWLEKYLEIEKITKTFIID